MSGAMTNKGDKPVARFGDGVKRALDSDIFHSFLKSPVTIVASIVTLVMILASVFAPLVAPHGDAEPAGFRAAAVLGGRGRCALSAGHRQSRP